MFHNRIRKPSLEEILAAFLFVSYFCSEILRSLFARIIGGGVFDTVYNLVFLTAVLLLAVSGLSGRLVVPLICYGIIALLFLVTILIHPEYKEWYFEQSYGIQVQFFQAVGGIWAFLVVYLAEDKEKLLRLLRITCWLLFVFLIFRYASAQIRGYWVSYGKDYTRLESGYNLGFGYSMLFPVVFFSAQAFLGRKKLYWIPFSVGTALILLGGSRGAVIWVAAAFLFMFLYRWKAWSTKAKVRFFLIAAVAAIAAVFVSLYDEFIVEKLQQLFSSLGISSRTIDSILNGEFSDSNGRDVIYSITIERIKEGGLFGNGVFGERVAVGQSFRWGYAHNLFLELYAAFGYIGGTLVSGALVFSAVRTAISCKSTTERIIFITFLGASMKLMLSDSFWFHSAFWGLLAIMVMWRNKDAVQNEEPILQKYLVVR